MNLNPSSHISPYFDGEVNRIVGRALFETIRKYEKKALISEGNRVNNTPYILNMVYDMRVAESDIIQDTDYVNRYYYVDDSIRNKGK